MFRLLVLPFLFFCIESIYGTASNSLSDCNAVAAQFSSTCTGGVAVADINATAGTNVSCSSGFTSSTCPGTMYGGTCVFAHKLCVTCSGSSPTRIRVQTNGLPRFCPNAPGRIAQLNIDFEVNFNPDVSVNSPNQNPTTASALSSIVCSISNQASVPSASNYTARNSANTMTLAGVSVDGVTILNVNSANNVDPFFPAGGYAVETVDACLGHPSPSDNGYHYHVASGCAVSPPSGLITSCTSNSSCNANAATYSISTFNSYRNLTVIGIAKDGHVIYGPYTSGGVQVTSGFDICNGMFYDSIGNYGYFATQTYPYITGCFGPGNYPNFFPNCTTNPATNYTKSSFAISQTITTVTTSTTSATTSTATTTTATTTTSVTTTTVTTVTTKSGSAVGVSLLNYRMVVFVISVLFLHH